MPSPCWASRSHQPLQGGQRKQQLHILAGQPQASAALQIQLLAWARGDGRAGRVGLGSVAVSWPGRRKEQAESNLHNTQRSLHSERTRRLTAAARQAGRLVNLLTSR